MTPKSRHLLFLFFSTTFLIVTPLIIIYASGYRLSQDWRVEKTGLLAIESKPAGARILADQQILRDRLLPFSQTAALTPAKIKYLRAGEYDIKLELDGYWPWERRVRIEAGKSTFIEDIELIRHDQAALVLAGNFKECSLSSDKKKIALFHESTATIFDLNTSTSSSFSLGEAKKFKDQGAQWSFDNQKLLYGGYLFQISKWIYPEALSLLAGPEARLSTFPEDRSGGFYFSEADGIYWYDLGSNRRQTISKYNKLDSITEKDGRLYIAGQAAGRSFVEIYRNNGQEKISRINLPLSDYKFTHGSRDIELYDWRNSILYIINPSSVMPIKETLANAKHFSWRDEDTLIYANDFEIWSYESNTGSKNLITRVGKKIDSLSAPKDSGIIYFASENKLYSIDNLNHNSRHISEIAVLDRLTMLNSDSKGKLIYFLGRRQTEEGLFALNIK